MKSACFDDPTLVSTAGLVPVMALAQRAGLGSLAEELLSVPGSAGAHASAKVGAVVAGMVAGADSFEDPAAVAGTWTSPSSRPWAPITATWWVSA